jgi:hypothetical protein
VKESTSELIERLGAGLKPSPPSILDRWLVSALVAGAAAAFVMLVALLGLRPDLSSAAGGWMLWGKLVYGGALAGGAYVLCQQAARPAARPGWRIALVSVPVLLAVAAALVRLTDLPAQLRRSEWLGETAAVCPWLIGLLSLPCLLALGVVMRRAAPTHLRWGGFCAGLLAGALSMLVYSLHCPETGVAFVATWYTLGMCVPAAVGAVIGPRLLRW